MLKHKPRASRELFAETKMGIVTRSGQWFHTHSEAIESFVPGLLAKHALSKLIKEAYAWVRSADSLSLTLLFGLLFVLNPWLAALITITFHWVWYNFKSSFVNRYLGKFFHYLNSDAYLMIISLVALSALGIQGKYIGLGLGILFFFLLKIGLLNMLWDKLSDSSTNDLTLNDRVLKMIILSYAIYEDMAPGSLSYMEEKIMQMTIKRKKGKQ